MSPTCCTPETHSTIKKNSFDLCLLIKRIHISLITTHFTNYTHTDRDTLETFPLFLSLPYQWEAWKFSAPVLHVLESCAFGPGLVGSCGAQCVLLTQAPAVLRRPCMALESCQTLRGCPCEWGSVRVTTEPLQTSHFLPQ